MEKTVLSVGQCLPDGSRLQSFLKQHFSATTVHAVHRDDALKLMRSQPFDLVLVNRKLDADYSDGMEVLRAIKADAELRETPVMIVTNYEEHQRQAMAEGAVMGFGKLEYDRPETLERLRPWLGG